jgi:hypothetical protein
MAVDWKDFGNWVKQKRGGRPRSVIIDRARSVGGIRISISWLQTIEDGGRRVKGEWVEPSPEDNKLLALALALGVDPEDVFVRVSRELPDYIGPAWSRRRGIAGTPADEGPELEEVVERLDDLTTRVTSLERTIAKASMVDLTRRLAEPVALRPAADNPESPAEGPPTSVRGKAGDIARKKGSKGEPV